MFPFGVFISIIGFSHLKVYSMSGLSDEVLCFSVYWFFIYHQCFLMKSEASSGLCGTNSNKMLVKKEAKSVKKRNKKWLYLFRFSSVDQKMLII